MKRVAFIALCGALSIIPLIKANAADSSPFYIGATGSVDLPSDSTVSGSKTGKVKYKFSSGGDVSIGIKPEALNSETGNVRLELQGGYHAFGLKSVTANNATNSNPGRDFKAATAMANAYYDIHTSTPFTPYIGAGVGEAFMKFPTGKGLGNTDTTSHKLAYQAMAGVAYTPESMPKTDFTIGYRYMGTEKASFSTPGGNVDVGPLHDSAIEAGIRYHF